MPEVLTFKIEDFEGPLDLLLYLVGKNKMNLYDVNIMELIEQYTAAIREMQQDRMEISSEFIDMAAHLVQMKSALLLPRSPEAERMKAELTGRLIEYSACKEVAAQLGSRARDLYTVAREPMPLVGAAEYTRRHDPNWLVQAWFNLMGRSTRKKKPTQEKFEPLVTAPFVSVASRVSHMLRGLLKGSLQKMGQLFSHEESRSTNVSWRCRHPPGRVKVDDSGAAGLLNRRRKDKTPDKKAGPAVQPRGKPQHKRSDLPGAARAHPRRTRQGRRQRYLAAGPHTPQKKGQNAMTERQELGSLEAMLFAHAEPVETARLADALRLDADEVTTLLQKLQKRYDEQESGMVILYFEPDRWQMTTRPYYGEMVKRILDTRRNAPLSPAALEVLAVIAYNQPVSRSFIEQVRGVDSSSTVTKLLDKGLIEEAGRLDLPGKPVAFQVTDTFLRVFGLGSLADLPPLHGEAAESAEPEETEGDDGQLEWK